MSLQRREHRALTLFTLSTDPRGHALARRNKYIRGAMVHQIFRTSARQSRRIQRYGMSLPRRISTIFHVLEGSTSASATARAGPRTRLPIVWISLPYEPFPSTLLSSNHQFAALPPRPPFTHSSGTYGLLARALCPTPCPLIFCLSLHRTGFFKAVGFSVPLHRSLWLVFIIISRYAALRQQAIPVRLDTTTNRTDPNSRLPASEVASGRVGSTNGAEPCHRRATCYRRQRGDCASPEGTIVASARWRRTPRMHPQRKTRRHQKYTAQGSTKERAREGRDTLTASGTVAFAMRRRETKRTRGAGREKQSSWGKRPPFYPRRPALREQETRGYGDLSRTKRAHLCNR